MRIVLVTPYFAEHGGGVERSAQQIAWELATRPGIEIDWFASDTVPTASSDKSLRTHPVPAWNGFERLAGLPYPVWSPLGYRQLSRSISDADVVHVHEFAYPSSIAATVLARRHGVPIVLTQHTGIVRSGNRLLDAAHRLLQSTAGRLVMQAATATACVSETTRQNSELLGAKPASTMFIQNGVDLGVYRAFDSRHAAALRAEFAGTDARPVVLFAGRLIRKKGIGIVRNVAARFPRALFLIAGRGPVDPAQWGLENVKCLGFLTPVRMADLYNASDVLLLPSFCEGFPLVIQEAMACGTAILTTSEVTEACPPASDLMRSCPVPTGDDPEVWVEALSKLVSDRSWLDSRTERTARARAIWNWSRCADQYLDLFTRVIHVKPAGR